MSQETKRLILDDFLTKSRNVTDNYLKAWGKWEEIDQWAKIQEEELEFENAPTNLNRLEEFWDCFFAKLTLLHLQDIDDYAILESARSTLQKITKRSERALEEKSND